MLILTEKNGGCVRKMSVVTESVNTSRKNVRVFGPLMSDKDLQGVLLRIMM